MKVTAKQKKVNRKCYLKHKASIIARLKARQKERRAVILAHKNKPCADCGIQYPYYVMDFDHVRGEKIKAVGHLSWNAGLKRILAEIAKCDLVCSNCHRERTQKRLNGPIV